MMGFEEDSYRIKTNLGEVSISTEGFTCSGDGCPSTVKTEADVVIGGSDTVGVGLMPLLLDGYAGAVGAAAEITDTGKPNEILASLVGEQGFGDEMKSLLVNSTTSGNGFDKLLGRKIEISMSSRRIRPQEARELRDSGAGNMVSPSQEHIIAVDSLVLVTNPANPVKSLTQEQVAKIYAGEITNWSEVGGKDMAISILTLPEGSGTRSVFESRIFAGTGAVTSESAVIASTNADASQYVADNEGALAYVSFAFQRGGNPLTIINDCGISMTPDAFSARTEEYALQRRLYVYTREDTISEAGRAFVDYTTSEDADNVLVKAGFIGFAVDRRAQSMDGDRARSLLAPTDDVYESGFMREMLGQMVDYDRLSTTFRFRTGSARLDERGVIDKQRLINFLEQQPDGTEIVFVGFTDTVGEFDGNLDLSRRRAAQVEEDLRNTAGDRLPNVTMSSAGFGEIAPAACNENENGRQINRRVEVWIKSAN